MYIVSPALTRVPSVDHELLVEMQDTAACSSLWHVLGTLRQQLTALERRRVEYVDGVDKGAARAPAEGIGIFIVSGDGHAPQAVRERALQVLLFFFPLYFGRRNVESLNTRGLNLGRFVVDIASPHELFFPNTESSMAVPWLRLF